MLSDKWTVVAFYPIAYLPTGVRLTAYGGDATDLPAPVLQRYLDRIAAGTLSLGPSHTYRLDQIREAHNALDTNTVSGKLIVLTGPEG
jgi:NADPH:quinone reductase-like Zn-dependent oxidoreductase